MAPEYLWAFTDVATGITSGFPGSQLPLSPQRWFPYCRSYLKVRKCTMQMTLVLRAFHNSQPLVLVLSDDLRPGFPFSVEHQTFSLIHGFCRVHPSFESFRCVVFQTISIQCISGAQGRVQQQPHQLANSPESPQGGQPGPSRYAMASGAVDPALPAAGLVFLQG